MIRIGVSALLTALLLVACGVKTDLVPPDVMVPEAATDLRGVVRKGVVYLTWNAPRKNLNGSRPVDLVAFTVLRRDETRRCIECPGIFVPADRIEITPEVRAKGRTFRWEDRKLQEGVIYLYNVTGENHWGYQGPPSGVAVIHWCRPPAAPGKLTAQSRDSAVLLSWDLVPGADGYHIYRRMNDKPFPFDPANESLVSGDSFLDKGLRNETHYRYEVRTVTMCGDTPVEGGGSQEVYATPMDTTPPQPPTGLTALPRGDGLFLDWFPNFESDLRGYYIYRRETFENGARRIHDQPVTESSFLDHDVQRGKDYQYAVTAVDSSPRANESSRSEAVTVSYRGATE